MGKEGLEEGGYRTEDGLRRMGVEDWRTKMFGAD